MTSTNLSANDIFARLEYELDLDNNMPPRKWLIIRGILIHAKRRLLGESVDHSIVADWWEANG